MTELKMNKMKIAISGASGRMGHTLVEAILGDDETTLVGALCIADDSSIGTDAASFLGRPSGVLIDSDLNKSLEKADYLIDFTRPEGTLKHLDYCAAHGIKMIIGTTGFNEEGKAAIVAAAKKNRHSIRF
jgi:4-hydroxy-tetrahydrodipicolinate reductase